MKTKTKLINKEDVKKYCVGCGRKLAYRKDLDKTHYNDMTGAKRTNKYYVCPKFGSFDKNNVPEHHTQTYKIMEKVI